MGKPLHTVAETASFMASAKAEGMTDDERQAAIDLIAADPTVGDVIVRSGGCRKVRIPGRGKGKSGGYRVVTIFGGAHMPVYLLAVLSKGSRANFSPPEIAAMATLAKALVEAHRPRRPER